MISEFAQKVMILCGKHFCSVTSWVRTPRRNAAVSGHPESVHQLGLAVDLVPDFDTPGKYAEIARDARRLGLVAQVESDHVHVQAIPPMIVVDNG